MEITNGRISILISREGTTIEIYDADANIQFVEIKLTPEQLSSALSRLHRTECTIGVFGLDKVGKTMEHTEHTFVIPPELSRHNADKEALIRLAKETCPEGWEPDSYFGAKNSFYKEGNRDYARCTIRRWI